MRDVFGWSRPFAGDLLPPELFAMMGEAGWTPRHVWLDPEGLFSLHLLSR